MLSQRSHAALTGVHPDLARVIEAASHGARFHVTEGLRSIDRQHQLLAAGKSTTMKSRHLTGHAVDLVAVTAAGAVSYADADMRALAAVVKRAAQSLGVPIEWGGDWKQFCDTPHFQLPHRIYPTAEPADVTGSPWQQQVTPEQSPPDQAPSAGPPAQGKTGITEVAGVLTAGSPVPMVTEAAGSMSRLNAKGKAWQIVDLVLDLLTSPVFVTACITAAGGAYILLKRRAQKRVP